MREFFRSRFFKVIILVFALLLGFMIYAISQNGFGAVSSQIIGTVSAPFQKLSSYISETATDFFGKFVNAEEISRQNEELRQQIAELRDQLVDYGEVKRENDVLREQLGIKTADPSLELVSAAVVARDPAEQQFGSFTIDKGTQHGIHNRDVVITSEGLVGVVTEVGAYYSKVTTILSPEVKVGAVHPDTGEVGTISGTVALAEQGACQLSYLEEDSQIKKGDLIVTSGASGLFPKNIVIGLAGELQTAEHGISSYTTVTPVFDIKSVSQVFVVTGFDGKSQEGENG
ncbi:MAG: rod shape-determining protein MreC [Oscillospiraceae bacterium]|jgi:rod shape-determining protein MreC